MTELNQIIFFSAVIFAIGIAAVFQNSDIAKIRLGTIIIFSSCILNFTGFSNFNALSVEGQAIGCFIILAASLHIFIQLKLLNE